MGLAVEVFNWSRYGYLVSCDPDLIQVDSVNAAFDSDVMWWARELPRDKMQKALRNSLCLGLYLVPEGSSQQISSEGGSSAQAKYTGDKSSLIQVGLVRVVTDTVTFAYMTDVYILKEHQGKGLGRWMLECMKEIISGWPNFRRFMLIASDSMTLYEKTMGFKNWNECNTEGLSIGLLEGPGAQFLDH